MDVDERVSLEVLSPEGGTLPQDYWGTITEGLLADGKTRRMANRGPREAVGSIAIIVPLDVNEYIERGEDGRDSPNNVSYFVVSKVSEVGDLRN